MHRQNDNLKNSIKKTLHKDDRLWTDELKTNLNETLLIDLVENIDEKAIGLLLGDKKLKERFFAPVGDTFVFRAKEFRFFIEENQINNSYTDYKNIIGLSDSKKFLKNSNDIVIDFPYKDCVLEGGQSSEEGDDVYFEYEEQKTKTIKGEKTTQEAGYRHKTSKRQEIFFNRVLAYDEIDRLFDHKTLINWQRHTTKGDKEVTEIKRDKNGTIKENFIIKGNNLIALHSLKKQFARKIKLIYIDPPYNTGNDGFKYNDNFNHSTWLVFMKNRLEVARELLRDDGVIFVQCDDNEQAYLKVLMDDIFGRENFVNNIVWVSNLKGRQISKFGGASTKEYCLVFAKQSKNIGVFKGKVKALKSDMPSVYKGFNYKIHTDSIGEYVIKNELNNTNSLFNQKTRPSLVYTIFYNKKTKEFCVENPNNKDYTEIKPKKIPNTDDFYAWRWSKEKVLKDGKNDLEFIVNDEKIKIYTKIRDFTTTIFKDVMMDINTTSGTNELNALGYKNIFTYPKPEKYLKHLIEISTKQNDIVLDFFAGSGTTCAVAHKMGRQYIGVEQMDYIKDLPESRLIKVIAGEQGGISKDVAWSGGGEFIYCELAQWNETAKDKIVACESLEQLEVLFDELYDKYFLDYNLKIKEFRQKVSKEKEFRALSLDEHKKMFATMLDNNQLYICATEMEDAKYNIDKKSIQLSAKFYDTEL